MSSLEDSVPGPLDLAEGERSIALLARAQAGDERALASWIERYQERLLRIVRIRLGPAGTGLRRFLESQDVVQETWKAVLGALGDLSVTDDAHVMNWLARVATNEIRDQLDRVRARRRDRDEEVPIGSDSTADPTDAGPDPSALAERAELGEILDQAVGELPADYREVIVLRDYCGATWDAIAERLGRESVHAAQQLHQRAWIKLRRTAGPRMRGEDR